MAVFVGLFAIAALIVLPITMGTWDATGVVIAVGGVAIVAVVAILAVRRASRKKPPPDDSGE
jgi:membrane protein implicated in regulation of membrane protease activity